MKKTAELNINEYIMLAEEKVGYVGDLRYQRSYEKSGEFEILAFEQAKEPHFTYTYNWLEEADTPDGAVLGYFFIKLTDTKFYNNKTMKFEVIAGVQDEKEKNSHLHIRFRNEETGKYLKAYAFPVLNW